MHLPCCLSYLYELAFCKRQHKRKKLWINIGVNHFEEEKCGKTAPQMIWFGSVRLCAKKNGDETQPRGYRFLHKDDFQEQKVKSQDTLQITVKRLMFMTHVPTTSSSSTTISSWQSTFRMRMRFWLKIETDKLEWCDISLRSKTFNNARSAFYNNLLKTSKKCQQFHSFRFFSLLHRVHSYWRNFYDQKLSLRWKTRNHIKLARNIRVSSV